MVLLLNCPWVLVICSLTSCGIFAVTSFDLFWYSLLWWYLYNITSFRFGVGVMSLLCYYRCIAWVTIPKHQGSDICFQYSFVSIVPARSWTGNNIKKDKLCNIDSVNYLNPCKMQSPCTILNLILPFKKSGNQLVNSEAWLVPLKSHWSTWKMLSLLAHTEPTSQTTLASADPLGSHSGNTWTSLDYMSSCWFTQTPLWFTEIMLAFAGPLRPQ